MIKLFVSDIDGTLLDDKHQLANETQVAIKRLRAAGISFMVASGRDYESILDAINVLDIKIKCAALNGGDYRDNQGDSIVIRPIEEDVVDELYQIIKESDATLEYYCKNGSYTQIDQDQLVETYIQNFMCMFDMNYQQSETFTKSFKGIERLVTEKDFTKIKKHRIIKVEFHFNRLQEKQRVNNLLRKIDGIHLTDSGRLNIEVTHEKATKGNMIEEICQFYGYEKEEVVVIGDSANDLSMLTRFPHAYAMGNASQAIKDAAAHIAKDNAHHGVADIMMRVIEANQKEGM